jgi:hypothetical protein
MSDRVSMTVEVEGLRIEFRGGAGLFDDVMRGLLGPLARGARPFPAPAPVGEPAPAPLMEEPAPRVFAEAPPAPPPPSFRPPAFPPAAAPPTPAAAPPRPSGPAPAFDPAPLYAILAKEDGRRAERDAVLLALVALAASGKRDATAAEITAHLTAAGFPADGLKPKPILAKLSHRKGLAAPGLLPGTFRATPAGVSYVLRHARGD